MGSLLGRQKIAMVYGGGRVGLMGIIADALLSAGGEVIGVIPQEFVTREEAHRGIDELCVVKTMHERKAKMAELSDFFIALPGGFGTLEEFCEVLTWTQIGYHTKACGLLNVDKFFDPLLLFFDHASAVGFISQEDRSIVIARETPHDLLAAVAESQLALDRKPDASQTEAGCQ